MPVKRKIILSIIVAASGLLISTCAPSEATETVPITVPPEQVKAEVEATSSPEIGEATLEVPTEVPAEAAEEVPELSEGCTYNAYVMGWVMDYADPENVLNVAYHPDSPFQSTFWDDQVYRDLADRALLEQDSDARIGLWQQAEDILVTDYAVIIPIYHYDLTALVRPEIQAEYTPFGIPNYKRWQLPPGQDTLRVTLPVDPATLDPNTAADTDALDVLDQLMEPPYRYTGDGGLRPAGAESYAVSDDGLVYTIHLRQDATWSDGEPVTAQHYVDGITRLLDPATGADYAWLMYLIRGAEAFNTGERDAPSSVGVRAVDAQTLEITLEEAASHFDSILALYTMYPIRMDVIEQYGEAWIAPGSFVGNGPYLLTEWVRDDYIVVEKNPDYWGADTVTVERIEFSIFEEEAPKLAAYERGELDATAHLYDAELVIHILDKLPDHLRRVPFPGTFSVDLNTLRSPTNNLSLRRALASAVDRWAIIDGTLHMPWRLAACGAIPPEISGYQGCGEVGYGYDATVAQEYLQAALDEMAVDDPADVSINLWTNRGMEEPARAIADQWESNLGIEIKVAIMDYKGFLEILDACSG
ncbi:MAG: ABC transporter substrate-binding protein [Anaerolineae bacterium]|jgi:oligopeptide transport system substrate-binding protein